MFVFGEFVKFVVAAKWCLLNVMKRKKAALKRLEKHRRNLTISLYFRVEMLCQKHNDSDKSIMWRTHTAQHTRSSSHAFLAMQKAEHDEKT